MSIPICTRSSRIWDVEVRIFAGFADKTGASNEVASPCTRTRGYNTNKFKFIPFLSSDQSDSVFGDSGGSQRKLWNYIQGFPKLYSIGRVLESPDDG